MKVWDVLNATAPVSQRLDATTTVSARLMERSVHKWCLSRCYLSVQIRQRNSGTDICFSRFLQTCSMERCLETCTELILYEYKSVQIHAWLERFPWFFQRCFCTAGFRRQSRTMSCVDIDECNLSPHPVCKHTCLNTRGSYSCHCHPGFYLEPDNKSCKTKGAVGLDYASAVFVVALTIHFLGIL